MRTPGYHRRTGRWLTALAWLVCLGLSIGPSAAQTPLPEGSLPVEATAVLVEVEGVATLADFAAVERLLGDLPSVQDVQVTEVNGPSVTFSIRIPGGLDAIDSGLAASGRLTRSGIVNSRIVYQYRP